MRPARTVRYTFKERACSTLGAAIDSSIIQNALHVGVVGGDAIGRQGCGDSEDSAKGDDGCASTGQLGAERHHHAGHRPAAAQIFAQPIWPGDTALYWRRPDELGGDGGHSVALPHPAARLHVRSVARPSSATASTEQQSSGSTVPSFLRPTAGSLIVWPSCWRAWCQPSARPPSSTTPF